MGKQKKTILISAILIASAVTLFIPGLCIAGSLEPSDPPGPTMKTLDQIPPTWSQTLPASERFVSVLDYGWGNILDKETGLVWQKLPYNQGYNWYDTHWKCATRYQGYFDYPELIRMGWRLPTIHELASLVYKTHGLALPPGHPFIDVQLSNYWSSTTDFANSNRAWAVDFNEGIVNYFDKTDLHYVWCVRGGQGVQ